MSLFFAAQTIDDATIKAVGRVRGSGQALEESRRVLEAPWRKWAQAEPGDTTVGRCAACAELNVRYSRVHVFVLCSVGYRTLYSWTAYRVLFNTAREMCWPRRTESFFVTIIIMTPKKQIFVNLPRIEAWTVCEYIRRIWIYAVSKFVLFLILRIKCNDRAEPTFCYQNDTKLT